jgi:hypothetical protein
VHKENKKLVQTKSGDASFKQPQLLFGLASCFLCAHAANSTCNITDTNHCCADDANIGSSLAAAQKLSVAHLGALSKQHLGQQVSEALEFKWWPAAHEETSQMMLAEDRK